MRIAVINCHVAYLYMLSKTGHQFFVLKHKGNQCWDLQQRPLPPNVVLVEDAEQIERYAHTPADFFDAVIFQDNVIQTDKGIDVVDRLIFEQRKCKKIMLFHNSFLTQFRTAPPEKWAEIKKQLADKLQGCKKVFISEWKKQSWGMDGAVILPGIDTEEFAGWRGIKRLALTCLNNAGYRDFMNGTQKMRLAMADYKHLILGREQGQGNFAGSFDEYKNIVREALCYITLNNPEFEDDYNLAMLEAMSTGMPAITLDHPRSIIKSGINGFKSDDLQEINRFVHELTQEKAHIMGIAARNTVEKQFNINTFIDNWNEVLDMT